MQRIKVEKKRSIGKIERRVDRVTDKWSTTMLIKFSNKSIKVYDDQLL